MFNRSSNVAFATNTINDDLRYIRYAEAPNKPYQKAPLTSKQKKQRSKNKQAKKQRKNK